YDRKRVKEVGPNRACAEWLLKNGASVRYKNWGSLTSDYNQIPSGAPDQYKIEEIRAIKASVMAQGFDYLEGLGDVKKIHLEKCELVDDTTLAKFSFVKNTLEHVVLIGNDRITANGLSCLAALKNLKQIDLARLTGVKNEESATKLLKNELPGCVVNFDDNIAPAPELAEK
ncbi:unnamed protein product, partial [Didymodactylos carnosus]